jgi:hypothetical protein
LGFISSANNLVNITTRFAVNTPTPYTGFQMDVNGPAQSAIYYSSVTGAAQTMGTSGANVGFGIFYNITGTGTHILRFPVAQDASNIGKYICLRNNSGAVLSITLENIQGISPSPLVLNNAQSATVVVAISGINCNAVRYALF